MHYAPGCGGCGPRLPPTRPISASGCSHGPRSAHVCLSPCRTRHCLSPELLLMVRLFVLLASGVVVVVFGFNQLLKLLATSTS
eukprot:scaffold78320_cov40-Tisochrysis_lutea.AAC.3